MGSFGSKRPRAPSSLPPVDHPETQPAKKAKQSEPVTSKSTNSLLGINGVGNTSSTGLTTPAENGIDIDFIIVDIAYDNLKAILSQDFPHIKAASDLLDSMKACPDFRAAAPSADLKNFLERIETADPNDNAIDEDNKGVSWGHHQFTAGSLTCGSVMKSWEDIGNTNTARKIIAAAIRTCKIARHVCEKLKITTTSTSYISDTYLERVIEILWDLWKVAGAPTVTTTTRAPIPQPALPMPLDADGNINPASGSTAAASSEERPLKERLESLVREDLRKWINQHNVSVTPSNKLRSKDDLVNAILDDLSCPKPSQVEVDAMRAARKKGGSKK